MIASEDFRALGTGVRVLITDSARLADAVGAVQRELALIDQTYSRFRDDSELSRLCHTGGRWVAVSPVLAEAIALALRAARMTEGAVDPTIGQALRRLGYDRDYAATPADGPLQPVALSVAGWQTVDLDQAGHRVRIPRGVELDLGATGKAHAVDRAAAAACRATGAGVLVSVGGDMTVAGEAPPDGWPVLVAEDHAAPLHSAGDVVALRVGALATSTTTVRRWQRGQAVHHHIIDPRIGRPAAEYWRTVSVLAASCVDGNTAATAAIVFGAGAVDWLLKHRLPARLVAVDGTVLRLPAWPAQEAAA